MKIHRSVVGGKVLFHLLELEDELLCYFQNVAMDKFVKNFENDIWCAKLAYLADIFKYLNSVNVFKVKIRILI